MDRAGADDKGAYLNDGDRVPRGALPEDLLRGWLLAIVAREPQHGYAITKKVRELPLATPHQTTIYRHLSSLEECGFLDSRWRMRTSAPPIRTYQLTDAGREQLRRTYGTISRLQQLCRAFLDEATDHL